MLVIRFMCSLLGIVRITGCKLQIASSIILKGYGGSKYLSLPNLSYYQI